MTHCNRFGMLYYTNCENNRAGGAMPPILPQHVPLSCGAKHPSALAATTWSFLPTNFLLDCNRAIETILTNLLLRFHSDDCKTNFVPHGRCGYNERVPNLLLCKVSFGPWTNKLSHSLLLASRLLENFKHSFKSNIDLQFILDVYSCATYCTDYIMFL